MLFLTCAQKLTWVSLIYRTERTAKKWGKTEKLKGKKRACSEASVNSLGSPWSQSWRTAGLVPLFPLSNSGHQCARVVLVCTGRYGVCAWCLGRWTQADEHRDGADHVAASSVSRRADDRTRRQHCPLCHAPAAEASSAPPTADSNMSVGSQRDPARVGKNRDLKK